ncbi:MAG: cell division protein FtsQ/DivIB [Brevefilum sp.]
MANPHKDDKNRAEQIRARRQQSRKQAPQAPFGNNATRKPKSKHVPVTRRKPTPAPVVTRKRHTTSVPLKKKGAELQIPALPSLRLGWRLISAAVFLLSFAVVISFASVSTFKISAINLAGAQHLTAEVLLSQIGLSGTSIINIEPEQVRARIEETFPMIKEASVSVSLPASITVQIEEREPVILWMQDSTAHWIDAEGVVFPVFGEAEVLQTVTAAGDPPPAPEIFIPEIDDETGEIIIRLEERDIRTTPKFVTAVLALSDVVPAGSDLQYNPQFGLGWRDPNGWLVYFGQDTHNIDTKLAEYQQILAVLEQQNVIPALISLEFLHAPYYRLEQ